MAQIGCYMSETEINELESYAASLEITRTAVFALAVQRELRNSGLSRSQAGRTEELRDSRNGRRRVTVHIANPALKAAFTAHAQSLGLGSDAAAKSLLEIELKERPLFEMFALSVNHG